MSIFHYNNITKIILSFFSVFRINNLSFLKLLKMYNLLEIINFKNLKKSFKNFKKKKPFNHAICDNFFKKKIVNKLIKEFPDYDDKNFWYEYNNPLEVKKSCNDWNKFKKNTYRIFLLLNSNIFINKLKKLTKIKNLFPDIGLHGGGLHIHKNGGKLNHHLDYNLHPKTSLQRKINLIIYLTKNWKSTYGGELGFWSHNKKKNQPMSLKKTIIPIHNRAVFFDTTQNSWHGFVNKVNTKKGLHRCSFAIYYMTTPSKKANKREKAFYAPTDDQKKNNNIIKLIKQRSKTATANIVYKKNKL